MSSRSIARKADWKRKCRKAGKLMLNMKIWILMNVRLKIVK